MLEPVDAPVHPPGHGVRGWRAVLGTDQPPGPWSLAGGSAPRELRADTRPVETHLACDPGTHRSPWQRSIWFGKCETRGSVEGGGGREDGHGSPGAARRGPRSSGAGPAGQSSGSRRLSRAFSF